MSAPLDIAGSVENTRDLWLSRQHRVLVDDDMVKSELHCDEALIAAHRFVGHARTCVAPQMHAVSYHHLLFDQHQIIFANGTAVESLYMGEQVVDMFQAEDLSSVPQRISPANETPARIIPNNQLQQKYTAVTGGKNLCTCRKHCFQRMFFRYTLGEVGEKLRIWR